MVQMEDAWILKDGKLSPTYAAFVQRSTLLSNMHETDRVVTFRFASDEAPPVNIHESHLRFADGPLAKFASDNNDFVEQRIGSVMLVDDRPEVFALIRKFLYLQSILLDDVRTSLITGLCEAADRWCLPKLLGPVLEHLAVIMKGASVDTLVLCAPIISTIPTVTKSQRLRFAESVALKFKDIVKITKAFATSQLGSAEASDTVEDKMQPPPQSVSDATLKSQDIVQDQNQSQSPCIGIWKSFSSHFGMSSHMVQMVLWNHFMGKQDILDLCNILISHLDEAENRDESLLELLLRYFPWDRISIDDVLGVNEYSALWSARSLRVLARAAVAAGQSSDERFALQVQIKYEEVMERAFKGIFVTSDRKSRSHLKFWLNARTVTDTAGVTNLALHVIAKRENTEMLQATKMVVRFVKGGCLCRSQNIGEYKCALKVTARLNRRRTRVGSSTFVRHRDLCNWLSNHEENCCFQIDAYIEME